MGISIGELARRSGVPAPTIRYYDSRGLLGSIARRENGRRDFGAGDMERLSFLRICRELEIPLGIVERLVRLQTGTESPCGELVVLLDAELARLDQRMRDLTSLSARLLEIREYCSPLSCADTGDGCKAFAEMNEANQN